MSTLGQSAYVVSSESFSFISTNASFFLQETLRLLCFDCLVADSLNVMSKTLDKRYWVGGRFIAAYNLFDVSLPEVERSILQAVRENAP
jgi:hypothetical protein